jgi:hypothetical protein
MPNRTSIKIKKGLVDRIRTIEDKYGYSRGKAVDVLLRKSVDYVIENGLDEFLKAMGGSENG